MAETWKKLAFFDEVATTFLGLSDTPGAYTTPGAYYKINAGGDAVEEGLVAGAASGLATLDAASKCAQDPKAHKTSHENGGGDEISVAGLSGELADDQPAKAHKASHQSAGADELDLTGMKADSLAEQTADTGVTVDTCLIKDGKVADSNLLEGDSKATVQDHAPKAHKASHQDGGTDELTLDALGEPVAAVPFDGQQATDLVVHSVANAVARPTPVVAKVCHQQDDDHLYLCTVAV